MSRSLKLQNDNYLDISSIVYNQVPLINMFTYSTEEHIVGVWIDGKPIYAKTIPFKTGGSAGDKSIPHGISNMGLCILATGFIQFNPGTGYEYRFLPNLYRDMQSYYTLAVYFVNTTNINITYGSERLNKSGYITLYYTKTTD